MAVSIQIPSLGESITQAVLVKWHKKTGDTVSKDEAVCELETDKANVDVPSPADGVIRCLVEEGQTVAIGQEIAAIAQEAGAAAPAKPVTKAPPPVTVNSQPSKPVTPAPAPAPRPAVVTPVAQRVAAETGVNPAQVAGSGPQGRVTKQDVLSAVAQRPKVFAGTLPGTESTKAAAIPEPATAIPQEPLPTPAAVEDGVRYEPMSKIRIKIAQRLVAAQQTAAILTTFNEVNMSAVQDMRNRYKERFTEVYGVGLGLMSFFVRATVLALREFPRVNAFIEGENIVYHDYVNMGIAVSTERGLAVPVLRHAHKLGFAKIEAEIRRLATAVRDGKLSLDELSGGTFTITNGGIFGSLLSTPILNPPQSAILGMHTIQKRPIAVEDRVEIHPMMYLALSYDHRLVDGRESVSFLVRMKQLLEDPARLMLEV